MGGHHVLTLSDLQERSGVSIHDGLREPSITDIGSTIFHDAVEGSLMGIITEVLREQLEQELLQPHGWCGKVPDVRKFLKEREAAEKQRLERIKKKQKADEK